MPRSARTVLVGAPHHVIQRGVRGSTVFFTDEDRRVYLGLLTQQARIHGLAVWAWCLLDNHIHLTAVPASADSISLAMSNTHRSYARRVNIRQGEHGHLFQGRPAIIPIREDAHLLAVARYIDLNPVNAGLAENAGDYHWSSARHHLTSAPDPLVCGSPIREMVPDWEAFLRDGVEARRQRHLVETAILTGQWPKASQDA